MSTVLTRSTSPRASVVLKDRRVRRNRWFVPWVFMLPVVLLQALFLFLPLANTFVLAFTNASTIGGGAFTGLRNFQLLLADPAFWGAVERTLLYVVATVPVIVVLSLALAVLLNTTIRGAAIVRSILFSPMVLPMAVVALLFQFVFASDGLVNELLSGLRIGPVAFLNDSTLALFSVMGVTVWKSCALYTLITLAALQNVSQELDEAAELDGAGWWRRTVSITLPQIGGTTRLVTVLAAVAGLRIFTEPFVMTGGGPGNATQTLVLYLFQKGISPGTQAGYASAVSLVVFVVVLLVAGLGWLLSRREGK